jgi:hypothetical protein
VLIQLRDILKDCQPGDDVELQPEQWKALFDSLPVPDGKISLHVYLAVQEFYLAVRCAPIAKPKCWRETEAVS